MIESNPRLAITTIKIKTKTCADAANDNKKPKSISVYICARAYMGNNVRRMVKMAMMMMKIRQREKERLY